MIFVGSGAAEAAAEVLAVAEQAAGAGRHLYRRQRHRQRPALPGAEPARRARMWRGADVVLAVGTRFNQPQIRWGLDGDIKVIRIDIDPVEITRIARPAIGIVADAKEALAALRRALGTATEHAVAQGRARGAEGARPTPGCARHSGRNASTSTAIRAELPDDGIYVEDLTQVGYVGRLAFPVYQPRTYIHSGYQGTLGFSFATALGAKVGAARSAGRLGLGRWRVHVQRAGAVDRGACTASTSVAIVFADGAYGNVRRMQKEDYGNRLIAVDLLNPNFPKMAESFGIAGVRATSPDALRRELAAALKRRGTSLIEVAGRRNARSVAESGHAAGARALASAVSSAAASAWRRPDCRHSGARWRCGGDAGGAAARCRRRSRRTRRAARSRASSRY